jgi:hypothetical protein
MRKLLLAALVLFANEPFAVAQTYSAACPIAGRYAVAGQLTGGSGTYRGEATITSNGVGCYVKWFPPNTSEGSGTYSNGVLTVNFQLGNEAGVVRYDRLSTGELRGTFWSEANPNYIQGTERLIPIQLAVP